MAQGETSLSVIEHQNEAFPMYYPISMFFTRSPSLYLPEIAIQYVPIRVHIVFQEPNPNWDYQEVSFEERQIMQ